MSTFSKVIVSALMAQVNAFEYMPLYVGQECTVNKKGQLPPGGCGTGTESAPDPALACMNPKNNKPFRHTSRGPRERTGYCGSPNDPYLGAACTGGAKGSCGNGVEDSTGYSCDDPTNPGTPAAEGEDGQCMRTEPTYWGDRCGEEGATGECGAGRAPEYTSDKDWFCLKPTGQKKGYCTIKCEQGTENACADGFSCQNAPGTEDQPIEGGPGVCVKDKHHPHHPHHKPTWGQKCRMGARGACAHGEPPMTSEDAPDGEFFCFFNYCTQTCQEGTESPCPHGFTCKGGFPFEKRVGHRGICIENRHLEDEAE